MTMLMIVARDSTVNELEELLHANGITAYSVIHKVEGRGQTGVVGTFHYNIYTGSTHFNLMILAVLTSEQVERAVNALKAYHEARKTIPKAEPLALKLFAFPCEELL